MTGEESAIQLLQRIREYFVAEGLPEEMLAATCIDDRDAVVLAAIIAANRPRRILEVGTFVGMSTAFLALCAGGTHSNIVSVDPVFPVDVQGERFGYLPGWSVDHGLRMVGRHFGFEARLHHVRGYYSCVPQPQFLANPVRHGVDPSKREIVGAHVGTHGPFDLIFIDGDHYGATVASDLALAAQQLAFRGLIVMHDFEGGWAPEVCSGTEMFLAKTPGFDVRQEQALGVVARRTAKESQAPRSPLP